MRSLTQPLHTRSEFNRSLRSFAVILTAIGIVMGVYGFTTSGNLSFLSFAWQSIHNAIDHHVAGSSTWFWVTGCASTVAGAIWLVGFERIYTERARNPDMTLLRMPWATALTAVFILINACFLTVFEHTYTSGMRLTPYQDVMVMVCHAMVFIAIVIGSVATAVTLVSRFYDV